MDPFTPTPGCLMPELTSRQELALLARALWREGYDDHLAGHITSNLGDGTLLCNPWLLTWAEVRPEHVLASRSTATSSRANGRFPSESPSTSSSTVDGPISAGPPTATRGSARSGPTWATCPRSSTSPPHSAVVSWCWSTSTRVRSTMPPRPDGPSSRWVAPRWRCSPVTASSCSAARRRAVHQRAVALEQRCRNAWFARVAGGSTTTALPVTFLEFMAASDGEGFHGFFEAAVRAELRADPSLLE